MLKSILSFYYQMQVFMFNWIDVEKLVGLFSFEQYDPVVFGTSFFLFYFFAFLFVFRILAKTKDLKVWTIIFFSIFFYYKAAGIYFLLLVFSAIFNFYIGQWIFNSKNENFRRIIFFASIFVNLGVLVYFKYTNFLLEILTDLQVGQFNPLTIFLPIGISFYTFKAMSYVIEIYMEMLEPVKSLRNFSLFIFFFPNVLMGPIDRASEFLPQIEGDFSVSKEDIGRAVFLIIVGLIKKHVIADYIGLNFVDRVFEVPLRFTGTENLLAIYGYSIQIYCDFSGYTDMALGIALLLGFKMRKNFNFPFMANSVMNYWQRWHMSLSLWLLDYLFKPLQMGLRNMRGFGNAFAVLITFTTVGLWHGANWNFVIFGLIHSVFIIFSMLTKPLRTKFYDKVGLANSKVVNFFQIVFTFHLLMFSGVFFRAISFDSALEVFHQVFTFMKPEVFPQFLESNTFIIILIVLGYIGHFTPQKIVDKITSLITRMPVVMQALLIAVVIWIVIQVKSADIQPFIYFQF
ncbi:MAG: MBOAT family O-acyltransferase [Ignavibacteria bacterium]|nr:MBOAT family O-acyltransferase [Ignavibacteria bacterium]